MINFPKAAFCLPIFIFIFLLYTSAKAEMALKTDYKENIAGVGYTEFSIISKEDDPVTITGYKINRGNTLSFFQKDNNSDPMSVTLPVTLNFGQKVRLFALPSDEEVLEVEVRLNGHREKW